MDYILFYGEDYVKMGSDANPNKKEISPFYPSDLCDLLIAQWSTSFQYQFDF